MARLVPYFCEIQLMVSAGSTSANPVVPPSLPPLLPSLPLLPSPPPSPEQPASVALTVNAPAPSARMNVRLLCTRPAGTASASHIRLTVF
jgi:hypothetical protein